MHAANNIPHTPDSGQELPPTLKQRIHQASQSPETALALIKEWFGDNLPDPAAVLAILDSFESEALEQAARLLGGEWTE